MYKATVSANAVYYQQSIPTYLTGNLRYFMHHHIVAIDCRCCYQEFETDFHIETKIKCSVNQTIHTFMHTESTHRMWEG